MSARAPVRLEGWRRKPEVRMEGYETSGAVFVDQPTPRWHLSGPYVAEDLRRILRGEVCIRCWTPYPAPLNIGSRRVIMAECGPFPDKTLLDVQLLIDSGHCPHCAAEVSPEMARTFFEGYVKRVHDPATLEPGSHGEYEYLIQKSLAPEKQLYLPPGWSS